MKGNKCKCLYNTYYVTNIITIKWPRFDPRATVKKMIQVKLELKSALSRVSLRLFSLDKGESILLITKIYCKINRNDGKLFVKTQNVSYSMRHTVWVILYMYDTES